MGAAKDWGIPLVLALLTFAGLIALPDKDAPAPHGEGATTTGPSGNVTHAELLFPFELVWVDAEAGIASRTATTTPSFTLVPINPRGPSATMYALLRPRIGEGDPCPMAHTSRFDRGIIIDTSYSGHCLGPGIARYSLPTGGATNGGSVNVVVAPEGPRLGEAGYNATRVTVHVFNGAGELVASNGNASEQARLGNGRSPEQLPGDVWYLGTNETTPEGTQPLPGAGRVLLPQLRTLLAGLPVGGVATTQTDAVHELYGTLYVTARLDELVQAP